MTSELQPLVEASEQVETIEAPVSLTWTPELTARFWNYVSQTVLNDLSFSKLNGSYVKFVFQHFLQKDLRYLDYGGGGGHLARIFVDDGYKMGVYDPAEMRAEDSVKLLEGQANFLGCEQPGSSQTYDGVFMIEVVEHILDESMATTFQTVRDFLRPDGLLFITTPNHEDLSLGAAIDPVSGSTFHRWQHVRSWTKQLLDETLKQHGFEAIVMHEVEFTSRVFDPSGADVLHRPDFEQFFNTMRSIRLGDGSGLVCVARHVQRSRDAFSNRFPRLWTAMPAITIPLKIAVEPPPPAELAPPATRLRSSSRDVIEIVLSTDRMIAGEGFGWLYSMPEILDGDTIEQPAASDVWLMEDGVPLGPPHIVHEIIRTVGGGRFSHWQRQLLFSTSDNTSPVSNGRQYTLLVDLKPKVPGP